MDNTTTTDCLNGRNSDLRYTDWLFIIFLITLLLVIFFSTILDIYMEESKRTNLFRTFFAFSVYKNGKQLFSIKNDNEIIKCLDGIRFLSICWVVLGHIPTVVIFFFPFFDPNELYKFNHKISSMAYVSGTVAVDTFFILSGLLISRTFLLSNDKGVKINIALYYISRYVRLTPALAVVIAVHVTILPYFGCGPYWPISLTITEGFCNKHWWATLLYIQNIVEANKICVVQSWYLAVDMQLYLISPVILYSLIRWPKWTVRVLFMSIAVEIILCFYIVYTNEIPLLPGIGGQPALGMSKYYANTAVRFGPWVIGLLLGYFIYNTEDNKTFNQMLNNKWFTLIGWMLAIIAAGIIVCAPYKISLIKYARLESTVHLSFHRTGWSLIMSWMIYTCAVGHGGIINWFLSLPVFHILSKLSYCLYITHYTAQIVRLGISKSPPTIDDFSNIHNFCGNLLLSTFLAIMLKLAVEIPAINLVNTCIKKAKKNWEENIASNKINEIKNST